MKQLSFLLVIFLVCLVLSPYASTRISSAFTQTFTYNPKVPLTHCMRFGPLDAYQFEWTVDTSVKRALEMRFTANLQRGYTTFGFTKNSNLQLISGYPPEALPCARRLYDNYSPYNLAGDVYPSYPETPANEVYYNISHVSHYVMRNLSTTAKTMLDSGGNLSTNVTLLWGFGLESMYNDACYNLDMTGTAEYGQMVVTFTDDFYRVVNGSCPTYQGNTTSWRNLPKLGTVLLEKESNQNTRMAGLLIGGDMLLQTGQAAPTYVVPPGYVEAGENYANACQSSRNSLKMRWGGFSDKVGGVQYYEVTAGTAAQPSRYLDRINVGTNQGYTFNGVGLARNDTIYITLAAINFAGLKTEVHLPAMRVLNNNDPTFGVVLDGTAAQTLGGNVTVLYTQSLTSLSANWLDYITQDHSAIDANTSAVTENGYDYAVGIYGQNPDSFVAWTHVASFQTAITLSGLTLAHGTRYYFGIRTTNCAGVQVIGTSPGITVDVVSPSRGFVYFSNRTGFTNPTIKRSNRLEVNWMAFSDYTSGIAMYEYAIGKTAMPLSDTSNLGMIVPWTSVGLAKRVTNPTKIYSLSLAIQALVPVGTLLYAYVKATDGAGNWAIAHSNSTTVVAD